MSFYRPPTDMDLACFGGEVRFMVERPAFVGGAAEGGFVKGRAAYSRSRIKMMLRISPLTEGDVGHLRHIWRTTHRAAPVLIRLPGNQKPIHARIRSSLRTNQVTRTLWGASFEFEEII